MEYEKNTTVNAQPKQDEIKDKVHVPSFIYADYNGSAPLSEEVKEYLLERIQTGPFANPNAIHNLGAKTLMGMEKARKICAKALGASSHQVIFNSGSTEGISTIFHTLTEKGKEEGRDLIVISALEHSAIPNTAQLYVEKGFELRVLPITENGLADISVLRNWLQADGDRMAMVALMAANNESGVVQPFVVAGDMCREKGVPFFCDTTQFVGKAPFDFKESGMDFAVVSGHKLGALTGTGILLAKDPTTIKPLIVGGGQENNLRGGTQNYLGNETMAVALNALPHSLANIGILTEKREEFERKIKMAFPSVVIIGDKAPRLSTTTYISYPGIHGQAVQIELEARNIFVTTSSACSDNSPATSKMLKAMGLGDKVGRGVVRISLGLTSPLSYYDLIFEELKKAYEKLGKVKAF